MAIIGIDKAIRDFNKWDALYRIVFDKSTGEVWTDMAYKKEDLKEYPGENILVVATKGLDGSKNIDLISHEILNLLILTIEEHSKPICLTIEIRGGGLSNVSADKPILTKILDWDNIGEGENPCADCEVGNCKTCSYSLNT